LAAIFGALSIVGLLGAVIAIVFSRCAGISVAAWLALQLAPLLAPNLSGPEALEKAIRKDRASGAAKPNQALQRRFEFHEESVEGQRIFRLVARERIDEKCHLLYLHGGAYVLNLQRPQWLMAAGLLERIGHQLVAPLYSLAPEASWREGLRDVERTYLGLVRKHGSENIAVVGDSAGGGPLHSH
jgi:epsilon-lactone hydrolase